ncbi:hypothetical protein [Nocardia acidivorans]|uniref:hypothetical protein n=1 Tax=Nocardia acidivorans TaxID=404580 RepID=UPI0008370CF1|nr:hypothetical protein [Nocardia acidivorans]
MTSPIDQPRIADQSAHDLRVSLDQQIRVLTDQLSMGGTRNLEEHRQGLLKLQDLQDQRRDAFRREVGWEQ